jgi:hypothetical protein
VPGSIIVGAIGAAAIVFDQYRRRIFRKFSESESQNVLKKRKSRHVFCDCDSMLPAGGADLRAIPSSIVEQSFTDMPGTNQ